MTTEEQTPIHAQTAELKLCYVEEPWAWFTTLPLDKQWGDDWNDAPYEHNAGTPYQYIEHNLKRGDEPWTVTKVAYSGGQLYTPSERFTGPNTPFSVEGINNQEVAWLGPDKWTDHNIRIWAGTTLADFIGLVHAAGGTVYLPVS